MQNTETVECTQVKIEHIPAENARIETNTVFTEDQIRQVIAEKARLDPNSLSLITKKVVDVEEAQTPFLYEFAMLGDPTEAHPNVAYSYMLHGDYKGQCGSMGTITTTITTMYLTQNGECEYAETLCDYNEITGEWQSQNSNHTATDSRYFSGIPYSALTPDITGEKVHKGNGEFASNGVVVFRIYTHDFTVEHVPQQVIECFRDKLVGEEVTVPEYYYGVHFIPFDATRYSGEDTRLEVTRMSILAARNLYNYLVEVNELDQTIMYGTTNPRMALIVSQCGFKTLGVTSLDLKKAVKNDTEMQVGVITTVKDFKAAVESDRFLKLEARLVGEKKEPTRGEK